MQEIITSVITMVDTMTGGNAFLTTGIIGGITVALRKVPFRIYRGVRARLYYTIVLDADGSGTSAFGVRAIERLIRKYGIDAMIRHYRVSNYLPSKNHFNIGAGNGTSPCWYKRRLFWVSRKDLPSDGAERQKYRLTVSYFGLSIAPLKDFLNSMVIEKDHTMHGLSDFNRCVSQVKKVFLSDLALSAHDEEFFRGQIKAFEDRREFAKEKNLDHKMILVLPGEPGSGKSALAKSIAAEMDRSLYTLDPNDKESCIKALSSVEMIRKRVYLFEDIHSVATLRNDNAIEPVFTGTMLSLDRLLNILQPTAPAEELVIILTANDLDKLHPAILRPSRVTAVHEMARIAPERVKQAMVECFGDGLGSLQVTKAWRGCDISFFMETYFAGQFKAKNLVTYIESEIPEQPAIQNRNLSDFMLECSNNEKA